MRALLLAAGVAATPAHADLYRWVDPESGSVKYSTMAPSWYGEAGRAPAVEVVPYEPLGVSKKPNEAPVLALEARWRVLLQSFSALTPSDFEKAGPGLGEQLKTYQAVVAELDRLDPAGRTRRQAQEALILERLKK